MRITSGLLSALAILISVHVHGQDTIENKYGKGLVNIVAKDSSYSAVVGLRMQSLFTSDWGISNEDFLHSGQANILVRRARLKFDGFAYSPRLRYKIEMGLSNRDISGSSQYTGNTPRLLLDAVVKWNFYKNFELWAGQTKLPGNRERLISSASLETVDRSLVNAYFNVDRDMGVQLHHKFLIGRSIVIKEAVSVSQGEGRNITSGNIGGFQYTGRLEILPFGDFQAYSGADFAREKHPRLAFAVAFDYNDDAVRTRSNSGSFMNTDQGFFQTDITTFFADAIFKFRGFSAMAEYALRNADKEIAENSDGTLTGDTVNSGEGLNLQVGYLFANDIQLLGRYTNVDYDTQVALPQENQFTLGLSKYISNHKLKVQTDLSYTEFSSGLDNKLTYRLQFELQL